MRRSAAVLEVGNRHRRRVVAAAVGLVVLGVGGLGVAVSRDDTPVAVSTEVRSTDPSATTTVAAAGSGRSVGQLTNLDACPGLVLAFEGLPAGWSSTVAPLVDSAGATAGLAGPERGSFVEIHAITSPYGEPPPGGGRLVPGAVIRIPVFDVHEGVATRVPVVWDGRDCPIHLVGRGVDDVTFVAVAWGMRKRWAELTVTQPEHGVWPEESDAGWLEARIRLSAGDDPWRSSAEETAVAFGREVLRWPDAQVAGRRAVEGGGVGLEVQSPSLGRRVSVGLREAGGTPYWVVVGLFPVIEGEFAHYGLEVSLSQRELVVSWPGFGLGAAVAWRVVFGEVVLDERQSLAASGAEGLVTVPLEGRPPTSGVIRLLSLDSDGRAISGIAVIIPAGSRGGMW